MYTLTRQSILLVTQLSNRHGLEVNRRQSLNGRWAVEVGLATALT